MVKLRRNRKKRVMLVSHANNTHPWLCPIRFMLLFVWTVGHRSGFLFAPSNQLGETHNYLINSTQVRATPRLNVEKGMTKMKFTQDAQFCITSILRRKARTGLHVWRNAACLMAQLAKGYPDEIRKSARHKTLGSCSWLTHVKHSSLHLVVNALPWCCTNDD